MPAPYDYTIGENIASPQQSFLQGIQMVDALRKREQDQAAAIEAKRKEAELQALYAEALKPDAKPEVFQRLNFAIDPKGAALSRMQQLNDAQQDAIISNVGSVWTPLLAGKPDLAIQRADELIKGMENSPNPDHKSLQALKASRQALSQSPELAQVSLATTLMGFGDKGSKFVNNAYEAIKKPVEQRKAAAEALNEEAKTAFIGIPDDAQMAQWWTNASQAQKDAYLKIQQVKKPPTPVTNIQIDNLLDKTGMAEVAKLMPAYQEKMISAASQLDKIPEYKAALSNAITGPGAEIRLTGARVANLLGFTGDKALQDTATLVQGLAQQTLDARGSLAGQGQITEGEQKLLMRAKSGDITMSPKELETLFKVSERAANAQYDQGKKMLEGAKARGSQTADLLLSTTPMPANRVQDPKTGKTYTRPAQMNDAQWNAYKQSLGAQ
jgi:hypothetical protein